MTHRETYAPEQVPDNSRIVEAIHRRDFDTAARLIVLHVYPQAERHITSATVHRP